MNIWIDLANSPHVIFFLPLIKRLKENGHAVFISIRDFAQTVPLTQKHGIQGKIMGKHGGSNFSLKMINLVKRTCQLTHFAKGKSIDIAVSHNSYTHTLAGRLIGARVITIMDYEGQPANHLAFRLAHKVIVPKLFPNSALNRFGAKEQKIYRYDGFKEQLYISYFKPNNKFITELIDACNINRTKIENKIIVSVRTPPTMAIYHHFQNDIFDHLLDNLNKNDDVFTIVCPRTKEQGENIKHNYTNIYIPAKPLDGMNLSYYSDLVISAGGTMNREAAILGTPAYSIFLGEMPRVDLELIKMGRMVHISNAEELGTIKYKKKKHADILKNYNLINEIEHEIMT